MMKMIKNLNQKITEELKNEDIGNESKYNKYNKYKININLHETDETDVMDNELVYNIQNIKPDDVNKYVELRAKLKSKIENKRFQQV